MDNNTNTRTEPIIIGNKHSVKCDVEGCEYVALHEQLAVARRMLGTHRNRIHNLLSESTIRNRRYPRKKKDEPIIRGPYKKSTPKQPPHIVQTKAPPPNSINFCPSCGNRIAVCHNCGHPAHECNRCLMKLDQLQIAIKTLANVQ